ncbi:transcriptional regulator NrdR [Streptobacillus felis]|uniref:Transcriptional repressor NrdR n=1 Tax=Streptobacillus felis TaxID=1384509 RepID=A0A7Z0PEG6_9FUSO|nr:transcriptional regulator NrdR [Streptobacillus felis]NYV27213.1 transcriptional repressor NrdR [Streptobacillus felis]
MKCPYCGDKETRVVDSRSYSDGNSIKRRRQCDICNKRFNTIEKIFNLPIVVIKKNGEIEEFDRNKVYQGIIRSLVKRTYVQNKVDEMIDEIERDILTNYDGKINSNRLGDMILEKLFLFDEVAYIRFASVYNKFENLDSFLNTIKEVKKRKEKR